MRRLGLLFALALMMGTQSCALYRSCDRQWSFAVSRHCYSSGVNLNFGRGCGCRGDGAAILIGAMAFVLLAPVVVDVVLLPVTGVRDLANN